MMDTEIKYYTELYNLLEKKSVKLIDLMKTGLLDIFGCS